MKYKLKEVLNFSVNPKSRGTVKRYYSLWREENSIPYRCDIESCVFHTEDLIWSGKELQMILDHVNGNSNDNRPVNLRYVCPNCDSQLPTRGGANKNRIINQSEGGYQVKHRSGKLDTLITTKPAKLSVLKLKGMEGFNFNQTQSERTSICLSPFSVGLFIVSS